MAAATQEWVHVDFDSLKPKQGTLEVAAAFPEIDIEPSISMPEYEPSDGARREFRFTMWQTWADPLAHANHPAYVDWCDEASSVHMRAAGLDPLLLRPLAETVTYRSAVLPGEEVLVQTKRIGVIGSDAVVLQHSIETERGRAAEAVTVRGLADGSAQPLIAAWA